MGTRKRALRGSLETSNELRAEAEQALSHPSEIFGYGRYGDGRQWGYLDKITGGLQPKSLSILAARPKRGKSMLAAAWVPYIAEQALAEDKVVRIVTLEMKRVSYQRRMASIMAGINEPLNIKRGTLLAPELKQYYKALDILASLPIEYLSTEEDLSEADALVTGNSPVTFSEMASFIRAEGGEETYWWVLDHIGLLADLSSGDVTASIYKLANQLAGLAHTVATGLVITHLTRQSVGALPSIESIAGSDQVGRNADQIFLLSRPFMDSPNLSEEDLEMIKGGEPAYLQFISRDEGGGMDLLYWNRELATFYEYQVEKGVKIPMPTERKAVRR